MTLHDGVVLNLQVDSAEIKRELSGTLLDGNLEVGKFRMAFYGEKAQEIGGVFDYSVGAARYAGIFALNYIVRP